MSNYRIEYSQESINRIIKSLENAISICKGAEGNDGHFEKTYAYAAGYSGSCMTNAIQDLQLVQSMLNELN